MPRPLRRIFGIDVLRGISILLVMITHHVAPLSETLRANDYTRNLATNAMYGVDLFFVISGYLITHNTLLRHGRLASIDVAQFYVMRVARIVPCVALVILIAWLFFLAGVPRFVPDPPGLFYEAVTRLFELQYGSFYLTKGNVPGLLSLSPLWSLSVEETFYLLFPLCCFFLRSDRLVAALAAALLLVGPAFRQDFGDVCLLGGAVDLLAMGCLTALGVAWLQDHPARGRLALPCLILGAAGAAAIIAGTQSRTDFQWAPSIIGLATALMVAGLALGEAAQAEARWRLPLVPLAFIGRMSLQLYVFHLMARELFGRGANPVLVLAGLILGAWLLERGFLSPANRWIRDLYAKPPAGAPVAEPPAHAERSLV